MAAKKLSTKPSRLNTFAYGTAIALAGFSGGVATFGMMRLVPGAEIVMGAMGLPFEAGKLTSFAMLHRRAIPKLLRLALAGVGLTLMAANIAGVSGFLSAQYERTHINAQTTTHVASATAYASAGLVERQLASAESNLTQAVRRSSARVTIRDECESRPGCHHRCRSGAGRLGNAIGGGSIDHGPGPGRRDQFHFGVRRGAVHRQRNGRQHRHRCALGFLLTCSDNEAK
jgi:hypothetical protein